MKKSPFSFLAYSFCLMFMNPEPQEDILTSVMQSSAQVLLLGVSPFSDPFFDHSLTPFICILLGNILIPFPAADLPSLSQSSINHQADTLRHIHPTLWCPLQGEGEHPCDRVCSVATVSSVRGGEISSPGWCVFLFYIFWLPCQVLHCTDLQALWR